MARRGSPIPKALRPLVGGAVLVASVRVIDVAWRRLTGRPTPIETETDASDAADAGVVRDRLLYALLLGGATRLARRAGLPTSEAKHEAKGAASDDQRTSRADRPADGTVNGPVNGKSPA